MSITIEQVLANRLAIKRMWQNIPPSWVDLNVYLRSYRGDEARLTSTELSTQLSGTRVPTNDCGAVGCFLGWNRAYKGYQTWCEEQNRSKRNKDSMDAFLGLARGHGLYGARKFNCITQYEEVQQRIKTMMDAPVCINGECI